MRDAAANPAMAQMRLARLSVTRKTVDNAFPPILVRSSKIPASGFEISVLPLGQAIWVKYEMMANPMPAAIGTIMMALGTVLAGSTVSSAMVDTASNPRNDT